jgi:hypothetical protein
MKICTIVRKTIFRVVLIVILVVEMLSLTGKTVRAADWTVTNNNNSAAGSLRQAIADANAGDSIYFDSDYTITLASTLMISKDLTIDGSGHNITINGDDSVGILRINSGKTVFLTALTIAHGSATSGGGISNYGSVTGLNPPQAPSFQRPGTKRVSRPRLQPGACQTRTYVLRLRPFHPGRLKTSPQS